MILFPPPSLLLLYLLSFLSHLIYFFTAQLIYFSLYHSRTLMNFKGIPFPCFRMGGQPGLGGIMLPYYSTQPTSISLSIYIFSIFFLTFPYSTNTLLQLQSLTIYTSNINSFLDTFIYGSLLKLSILIF